MARIAIVTVVFVLLLGTTIPTYAQTNELELAEVYFDSVLVNYTTGKIVIYVVSAWSDHVYEWQYEHAYLLACMLENFGVEPEYRKYPFKFNIMISPPFTGRPKPMMDQANKPFGGEATEAMCLARTNKITRAA
jgi:hypothetical protein